MTASPTAAPRSAQRPGGLVVALGLVLAVVAVVLGPVLDAHASSGPGLQRRDAVAASPVATGSVVAPLRRVLAGQHRARAPNHDTTAVGSRVAPNMTDDFVDLASPARRTHILQGDATGGGHLWPGTAGKTPFPQSWSGGRIMHEISDIATDPAAWRGAVPQGSRTVLTGTRGGVDIRVIVDSRTGEVITGYPTNLPRNP